MTVLKDGSYIADRRFDHIVQFDPRSRNFLIRAALDQGPDGACFR